MYHFLLHVSINKFRKIIIKCNNYIKYYDK